VRSGRGGAVWILPPHSNYSPLTPPPKFHRALICFQVEKTDISSASLRSWGGPVRFLPPPLQIFYTLPPPPTKRTHLVMARSWFFSQSPLPAQQHQLAQQSCRTCVASAVLLVLSVELPVCALAKAGARLWYRGFLCVHKIPLNTLSNNAFLLSGVPHP
jgi:hypothetical protein